MSSQSSSSSLKDTSKKESSELKKLHFVASFEHQKLLEDVSNKAYDLGVKAGREQANPPDDETQALILSLTDRNDELGRSRTLQPMRCWILPRTFVSTLVLLYIAEV